MRSLFQDRLSTASYGLPWPSGIQHDDHRVVPCVRWDGHPKTLHQTPHDNVSRGLNRHPSRPFRSLIVLCRLQVDDGKLSWHCTRAVVHDLRLPCGQNIAGVLRMSTFQLPRESDLPTWPVLVNPNGPKRKIAGRPDLETGSQANGKVSML